MFSNVLVLLDGSRVAEVVLEHVPRFACAASVGHVRLLRVLEGPADGEGSEAERYLRGQAAEVRRRWETHWCPVPELTVAALPCREGGVAHTITEFAAEVGADAVMLATHGWSGADWWSTGSVAQRVIRSAGIPVFAVRPTGSRHPRPGPLKRVLVPLDGSPLAERALAPAEHLAKAGIEVHLLRVDDREGSQRAGDTMTTPELAASGLAGYLNGLASALGKSGAEATATVRRGQPGQLIADMARDEAMDLVVMCSHGRSGPGRGALGGVTDHVLHACHVPLLVVPAAGACGKP